MIVAEEEIGRARASRDFWRPNPFQLFGHKSFRVMPIFWSGDYGFHILPGFAYS